MKEKYRKSRAAILEILRVVKMSRKEFAESIGAHPREVRQWTCNSPRPVPREYQKRIMACYGAEWDGSGKVWQAGGGQRRRFTLKSFKGWRERLIEMHKHRAGFPINPLNLVKANGERYDRFNIENFLNGRLQDIIGRTMAAAEDRRGENNYRRLFAVLESLILWSQGIVKDFNLSDSKHIQDVHRKPTKRGVNVKTNREKYIGLMKSIINAPAKQNDGVSRIIEKGSPRHNAHLEHLKTLAKKGDRAAIENLKQHNIEV